MALGSGEKVENLSATISFDIAWRNFVRLRQTLRVTPAMEAGITDHVWSVKGVRYRQKASLHPSRLHAVQMLARHVILCR